MSKTIKIQIIHSLALNSAKNETYQKGVVDQAVDAKLITAAFHEQYRRVWGDHFPFLG